MSRLVCAVGLCMALAGCAAGAPPTLPRTATPTDGPTLTATDDATPPTTAGPTSTPETTPTLSADPTSTPSTQPTVDASPPTSSAPPRFGVVASAACDRLDPKDRSICAGNWRIWVVNGDGTGGHELLSDEPGSQFPIAWSADGATLLYQSSELGGLGITDASGSRPRVVSGDLCPVAAPNCNAAFVSYSPDGSRLAYTTWVPCVVAAAEPCKWQDGTITVLDIATGHVTLLKASRIPGPSLCCDGYYRPSWSADGTRLAFAMPSLSSFIIDVDGSNLRPLAPPGESGTSPRWSPDGSAIASWICGVRPALYVADPEGEDIRTVETNGCDFEWNRDGRIVLRDQDAGEFDPNRTWIMDADGGNLQRLDDSVAALTAAGCLVCPLLDRDRLVSRGLWQPVPADAP